MVALPVRTYFTGGFGAGGSGMMSGSGGRGGGGRVGSTEAYRAGDRDRGWERAQWDAGALPLRGRAAPSPASLNAP
jgi:hypothetical protein